MNLAVITAFIAVCGAAKLDRTYLPPSSANTAGGSPGSLQVPFTRSSVQGLETPGLPTGSYANNFEGVVVDAASPGTRASADPDLSGLGGPRLSYGSTDSKVGDAAFRGSVAEIRNTPSFGATGQTNGQFDNHAGQHSLNRQVGNGKIDNAGQFSSSGQFSGQSFQGFTENKSERPQAASDRNSNIISLSNDVNSDSYSYGFQTDNGIAVGENGVAVNGVQAEGAYSYQGDDGQVYKVTYTADEGGYRPQGAHLPTPPPIPEEILKSLEQNAKEEAAGLVDDGSYDAHKYNDDDYMHDNGGNIQYNREQLSQFGKRPESDATVSGSFINQNGQAFKKPGSGPSGTGSDLHTFNGQSSHKGSGQFGASGSPHSTFNGPVGQENRKPEAGQFEFSGSQSTLNGQSSQGNGKPSLGQFGISGTQFIYNKQSNHGNEKPGSGQFGISGSQSTFNGQSSQGFEKPGSGQFGISESQSTFNGQSNQLNNKPGPGQLGITGSQLTFDGQSSQENVKPGSGQFGITGSQSAFNGQSSQGYEKPGSGQFGITGSQSTFNGQSNQGYGKPGSGQFGAGSQSYASYNGQSSQGNGNRFGSDSALAQHSDASQSSHSSQLLSGHHKGLLPTFIKNKLSSPSAMDQSAFENPAQFGSQTGQQASASAQFENQSPSSESQHSSSLQYGSRPMKPAFSQSTGSSAFNSQSAQPQFGSSFKPQGSEAFSGASLNQDQDAQDYGKPFPQTFSGQNFNRPSAGNFNSNKPSRGQVQANKESTVANSFNRFPQASSQNNDYLPPVISNGQPQLEKTKTFNLEFDSNVNYSGSSAPEFNLNSQEPGKNALIPDFVALNEQKPSFASASATTSFGQPAYESQPEKPSLNAINKQAQLKPNLFQKQTTQFSSQNPAQLSSNSQQSTSFAQTSSDFSLKPTSIPETELTTPLEPNETPVSALGSQFSGQTSSSFGSFDTKPANNKEQTQFGLQGISAFGQQSASQTLSPSFPTSSPQSNNVQFSTASTQSAFHSSKRPANSFGQNQQHRPLFNQGVDNSYYYNQPSKPFSVSGVRPEDSRFPSSPSYQSNRVAFENQFLNQQSSNKFSGSLAPAIPTSASHFAQTQGYNGITQAAISPFPSVSPTPFSQLGSTQNSQFASRPTFNKQSTFNSQFQSSGSQQSKPTFPQVSDKPTISSNPALQFGRKPITSTSGSQVLNQFGQSENTPESSDGSSQQHTTMTQQYQGTVYEYNKPAEVLSASSQTDSFSSQTIQSGVTSESNPSFVSQNQMPSKLNSEPFSQFGESGSKLSAQNKPFGSASSSQFGKLSQTGHGSQAPLQTGIQSGSQSAKPFNAPSSTGTQFSQTAQLGSFGVPTTSAQFSQNAQLTPDGSSSTAIQQNAQGSHQPFKPFGSLNQGIQSSIDSQPQSGSQATQFSQNSQTFASSQNSQPALISSQSQFSSQTFGNAALGQDSGYFYPGNPKPQFQNAEISKNKFSQNSHPDSPQRGSNQFNKLSQSTGQSQFVDQNSPPGSSFTESLNQKTTQSQFNSASKPQFGAQPTQFSQNTQAQFDQKAPSSLIQSFVQPTASSQAVASGQASASASATSSPQQQYKPFESQNKNQFGQIQKPESQDQNGQGTQQFGVQNLKPFSSNAQKPSDDASKPYGALNSKLFGAQGSAEASKPIFSSCCQESKDSTPSQSTDRPSEASFQGTPNFNSQDLAGKGEEFGGPRQPPRFDVQTGYHY